MYQYLLHQYNYNHHHTRTDLLYSNEGLALLTQEKLIELAKNLFIHYDGCHYQLIPFSADRQQHLINPDWFK